jgi:hypothetical protein
MRLLIFLLTATAFAQPDTGTITITASRNVTAVPDQLHYSVAVRTDVPSTLGDVVAKLAGTGITPADLTYVTSSGQVMEWTFDLVTSFSKMAEMNATLTRLQKQTEQLFQSPALTFRVTSQQTSTDAAAQACQLSALVSDARKEADRVASAAGAHVGAIVGLSEGTAATIPTSLERQGDFSVLSAVQIYDPVVGIPFSGFGLAQFLLPHSPVPTYTPPCSLVVQFRLVP